MGERYNENRIISARSLSLGYTHYLSWGHFVSRGLNTVKVKIGHRFLPLLAHFSLFSIYLADMITNTNVLAYTIMPQAYNNSIFTGCLSAIARRSPH